MNDSERLIYRVLTQEAQEAVENGYSWETVLGATARRCGIPFARVYEVAGG